MKLHILLIVAATSVLAKSPPSQEYGRGVPASCSKIPSDLAFVNKTYTLPNPFHFLNGDPVKTIKDWHCRAAQIRELFQKYELGYKPSKPPIFHSSYNGSALEIQAGLSETNTINFTVPVNSSTGGEKHKKSPAIIAYDGITIPISSSIATITLNVDTIAQQDNTSSRGQGLFYDLYGTSPNGKSTAGALMAWAWATSRVIDALLAHPEAGIDTTRVGVTGCSRNGKGAMVAGAFDDRIALTIPQESGSGGDACWRTSRDMLVNRDLATQTAQEIVTENVWFAPSFDFFGRDNYTVGLFPVDHHELAGLIAPRGLYSTENVGFLWLGDWSCWECMKAANRVYQALGVERNQGFSQDGPHDHCAWPDDQTGEITAFFDRFLLGEEDVETNVFRTVGNWSFDPKWVPWRTPLLL